MTVTDKAWQSYIKKLTAINRKAAKIMQDWISVNGLDYPEELISYAYGIVDKYGEAAGALACEMYDTLARAQGKILPDAVPAEPATYSEVARAVIGTKKERPGQVPDTVARLVKQTAADTTLQNAKRDGAQFAWIPHGDTCSFCITLASRGWQYMSKNALKNGHAEHIHANCDCEYGVRFDGKSNVAGYDPDKYLEQYNNAEGTKPQDKINSMRRQQYAADPEKYRAQKRAAYERRNQNTIIERVLKVAQEGQNAKIPKSLEGNFDGFDDLNLTAEERKTMIELRKKADQNDVEYVKVLYTDRDSTISTSGIYGRVGYTIDVDASNVKLYHSHTNDTLQSSEDLKKLTDIRINEVGVVTKNGDVFTVEIGDGFRPSAEEFEAAQKHIIDMATENAKNTDGFWEMSLEERNYLFIREKAFFTAREFGWRMRGGKL